MLPKGFAYRFRNSALGRRLVDGLDRRDINWLSSGGMQVYNIRGIVKMELDISRPIERALPIDLFEPEVTKRFLSILKEGDTENHVIVLFLLPLTLNLQDVANNVINTTAVLLSTGRPRLTFFWHSLARQEHR